ncbi:MAG TPA: hypothetical protein VLV87_02010 [Gammaproteobacteria bacterium]|nr:hypothetical protein [Gammaproteobacteria bacterium]
MTTLMRYSSLATLLLCGCASPEHKFKSEPDQYGLFVATTNIFANSQLMVQEEGTGKVYPIKIWHLAAGDSVGYAMASLPAGRYRLETYSPDGRDTYPLATGNGWFEVQDDCFNYGGRYDFEMGQDGMPTYTNTTTLQDIVGLPSHYRDLAQDRDICSANMGHPGERLKAADVAKVLPEL